MVNNLGSATHLFYGQQQDSWPPDALISLADHVSLLEGLSHNVILYINEYKVHCLAYIKSSVLTVWYNNMCIHMCLYVHTHIYIIPALIWVEISRSIQTMWTLNMQWNNKNLICILK